MSDAMLDVIMASVNEANSDIRIEYDDFDGDHYIIMYNDADVGWFSIGWFELDEWPTTILIDSDKFDVDRQEDVHFRINVSDPKSLDQLDVAMRHLIGTDRTKRRKAEIVWINAEKADAITLARKIITIHTPAAYWTHGCRK